MLASITFCNEEILSATQTQNSSPPLNDTQHRAEAALPESELGFLL